MAIGWEAGGYAGCHRLWRHLQGVPRSEAAEAKGRPCAVPAPSWPPLSFALSRQRGAPSEGPAVETPGCRRALGTFSAVREEQRALTRCHPRPSRGYLATNPPRGSGRLLRTCLLVVCPEATMCVDVGAYSGHKSNGGSIG
jgi:hypothetical protein